MDSLSDKRLTASALIVALGTTNERTVDNLPVDKTRTILKLAGGGREPSNLLAYLALLPSAIWHQFKTKAKLPIRAGTLSLGISVAIWSSVSLGQTDRASPASSPTTARPTIESDPATNAAGTPTSTSDGSRAENEDQNELRDIVICEDIVVRSPDKVEFDDKEKELLCGDKDNEAWSRIPTNQSVYFLRTFLQSRGYHQVAIDVSGSSVRATTSTKTSVSSVKILGSDLDPTRYWQIYGRPLTPEALDELGKWIKLELGRNGRPCSVVELSADPATAVVVAEVSEANPATFPEVKSDGIRGLLGGLEERYYAFKEDQPFNSLLLDLTARRMIRDDIVLNTHFLSYCEDGNLRLEQKIMSGEPRLLTFGVGFDTEEYLILRAAWRNSRLGTTGSQLEVSAYTSFRLQKARADFSWYYVPIITPHYLKFVGQYRREDTRRVEARTLTIEAGPAWSVDAWNARLNLWSGLTYELTETDRGRAPATTNIVALTGEARVQTHQYEYWRDDPREGHEFTLGVTSTTKAFGSDISANRYRLTATKLWNLFGFSPPIWVLGWRTALYTTDVGSNTPVTDLPIGYLYALGGSDNLRGFKLDGLPNNDLGALSSAYLGIESRVASVLPFNLQPIAFLDIGKLGSTAFNLEPSSYWSPGLGLHWKSPIGTLRTTLAHGLVAGPESSKLNHLAHWQFYLSYGEQF